MNNPLFRRAVRFYCARWFILNEGDFERSGSCSFAHLPHHTSRGYSEVRLTSGLVYVCLRSPLRPKRLFGRSFATLFKKWLTGFLKQRSLSHMRIMRACSALEAGAKRNAKNTRARFFEDQKSLAHYSWFRGHFSALPRHLPRCAAQGRVFAGFTLGAISLGLLTHEPRPRLSV